MATTIISKEEQPLLGRTKVKASVSFEGATPARTEVRKQLAKALKEEEAGVIIRTIETGFGGSKAAVTATIYKDLKDAQAVEHKSRMAKHEIKEEPKQEEAPEQEEKAEEEAPAEEKKEE